MESITVSCKSHFYKFKLHIKLLCQKISLLLELYGMNWCQLLSVRNSAKSKSMCFCRRKSVIKANLKPYPFTSCTYEITFPENQWNSLWNWRRGHAQFSWSQDLSVSKCEEREVLLAKSMICFCNSWLRQSLSTGHIAENKRPWGVQP